MKTMADLHDRFQLHAVCTDCDRMEQIRIQALIDRFGDDLTIDSVRRRLRCTGCGQRTEDIRIVYVGENARVSGFHYRGNAGTSPPMLPEVQPESSSVDSSVRPKPSTPT